MNLRINSISQKRSLYCEKRMFSLPSYCRTLRDKPADYDPGDLIAPYGATQVGAIVSTMTRCRLTTDVLAPALAVSHATPSG
ncbi:MAG: hypothetical protein WA948_10235, partial [Pontixanthobacter sp.]